MAEISRVTRITGLDVTRGFAVMGILAMNIIAFAWPSNVYISPLIGGGTAPADMAAWAINFVLVDSKMRGLFSMMFGASTLLVIEAASVSGSSPWRTHYARMAVLALFGLVHFYLIWFGDILILYAACGMLLFLFRGLSVRALLISGIALISLQTLFYAAALLALRLGAQAGIAELVEGYSAFVAQFSATAPETLKELAVYGGDYRGILHHRMIDNALDPFTSLLAFGMETLGLMLVGMALYKSGLLAGRWSPERVARWSSLCLGLGIVGNLALLAWQWDSALDIWVVVTSTFVWSVPFDLAMSAGYAALFMGLAVRFADRPIMARIAATGRAAFTNYLGTSLLMTTLFYGYGVGLFAEVSRAACYVFVAGAWALMLLWSKPWLDRFHYGPLEWAWRSLSRWQVQPLSR